jgi:hypothetical protein
VYAADLTNWIGTVKVARSALRYPKTALACGVKWLNRTRIWSGAQSRCLSDDGRGRGVRIENHGRGALEQGVAQGSIVHICVMTSPEALPRMSPEDYLAYEQDQPVRHEFVDGYLYAMTGATDRREEIALNLASALRVYLRGSPCRVYKSDLKIRVADDIQHTAAARVSVK